jgi:exopolysaccharide biosynthesis predicted pyruvyltransferase EpsI
VKNDQDILAKTRDLYLNNARIYINTEDEEAFTINKTEFMKFLERDEKYTLKL